MNLAEPINRVDLLDAFIERAAARALLWHAGEYELAEAVDKLLHDAERDGLVDELGEDGVQRIIANAFASFREASDE
jgi:hypothetical protein